MSPKLTLYVYVPSIWTKVPELALGELGYPSNEVEKKTVDLVKAENLAPEFHKISAAGTLPVLTVAEEGKSYTSTFDVVRWLVDHSPKGSVKHTTHPDLIEAVHDASVDPNFPFIGARSKDELLAKRKAFPAEFVKGRYENVLEFSKTATGELKEFYESKLPQLKFLNSIYTDADEKTVDEFIQTSIKHMQRVHAFILHTLPAHISSEGFVEGAEPGEADFHVAAWLARIALLSGAPTADTAKEALEKELNQPVPEKVVKYIQLWSKRPSWQQTYADGLH